MRGKSTDFAKKAMIVQTALEGEFWNDSKGTYDPYTIDNVLEVEHFHYWWQAHVVDVLVDGYERTRDPYYLAQVDILLQGVIKTNGGSIINDFYDDMEWMALALLRTYEHTKDPSHLEFVKVLWEDIKMAWNDLCGGGFAWQKEQLYYKNTPANAPAIILALRLYQLEKSQDNLSIAEQAFTWLEEHLVDPETGFVWDGINREEDMKVDKDWEFTYCQGVYVGACVEFYKVTGDRSYLKKAQRTIMTAFRLLTERGNVILHSEGVGDGGLFKGIFIRYVADYLKCEQDPKVLTYLSENALAAWASCRQEERNLFGECWLTANQVSSITLSTHLSGCMLMEALAQLQEESKIP